MARVTSPCAYLFVCANRSIRREASVDPDSTARSYQARAVVRSPVRPKTPSSASTMGFEGIAEHKGRLRVPGIGGVHKRERVQVRASERSSRPN